MSKVKKDLKNRAVALAVCGVLGAACAAGAAVGINDAVSRADTNSASITVNTDMQYQTLDGWGSTLAWWAHETGNWTRASSDGTTQREKIMEMLYGKSGLDWNIARYNIGGGDDPTHTHMPHARNMPGFKGATRNEDYDTYGDYERYKGLTPDDEYIWESENGDIAWDATDESGNALIADYEQLWVLDWIEKNRDDEMVEFFSNSPPYWMTGSGCASGASKGVLDPEKYGSLKYSNVKNDQGHLKDGRNLPVANEDAYVQYFLDVYEYLTDQGFEFDYLQPFNEPSSGYWPEGGSQEGCDFWNDQKVSVLQKLFAEMEARGIEIPVNFSDETNTQTAVASYNGVNGLPGGPEVLDQIGKLTYHIYSYDIGQAQNMYRFAKSTGKEIEMSEITFNQTAGEHDDNYMPAAFAYSNAIIDILKYCGAQSFIHWQAIEDKVGQIASKTNWGIMHGVYYTQDEAFAQGIDLAAMGLAYQDVTVSKSYYITGQFSKYIHQGYKIIESDDDRSLAAISPDGKEVVVVKQNNSANKLLETVNIEGFTIDSIKKIVTDQDNNWAESTLYPATENSFNDTVSESSVTTYVVKGDYHSGEVRFHDDPTAIKMNSVNDIRNAIQQAPQTEAFYQCGFSQTTSKKDYITGSTIYAKGGAGNYAALRFKGTGFALSASKADGSLKVWVDTFPSDDTGITLTNNTDYTITKRSVMYRMNDLDDGWHTVYVSPTGSSIQYLNIDAFFALDGKDKEEAAVPKITSATAQNGRIYMAFTPSAELKGYEYYADYRVIGGENIRSEAIAVIDGANGSLSFTPSVKADEYEVWVTAVKDTSEISSSVRGVRMGKTEEGVLYYVDCGTTYAAPTSKIQGRILGTLSSTFDQDFGTDVATGVAWGRSGTILAGGSQSYYGASSAANSIASGDGYTGNTIDYKFTIPKAGRYMVSLGLYDPWGERTIVTTAQVGGATVITGETDNTSVSFTAGKAPSVGTFKIETTAENSVVDLQFAKAAGSGNPTLSFIIITQLGESDSYNAIPVMTNKDSSISEGGGAIGGVFDLGDDFTKKFEETSVNIIYSDGSTSTYSFADEADGKLAVDKATVTALSTEGVIDVTYGLDLPITGERVTFPAQYTMAQFGVPMYYNIDSGTDGAYWAGGGFVKGTLQTSATVYDQEYKEGATTWGFVKRQGNSGNWANEGPLSSMNELQDGGGYTMEGFTANESLLVEISYNLHSWGPKTWKVKYNGTEHSEITVEAEKTTKHTVNADNTGKLAITFTGAKAAVSQIKIWKAAEGDSSITSNLTVDKTICARGTDITVSGVVSGATVYVYDDADGFIESIIPEGTSFTWNNWAKASSNASAINFVQCEKGVAGQIGKIQSAVATVSVPSVEIKLESDKMVKKGDAVVIRIKPALGSETLQSLKVIAPDKREYDVSDRFFHRATINGTYTVVMKCNGVESRYNVEVNNCDVVELNESYSTTKVTSGDVTLRIAPYSPAGIAEVQIDGAPVVLADDGSYVWTATENKDYAVKVVSALGSEEEYTLSVKNIDKSAVSLSMATALTNANGVKLSYSGTSGSAGKLYMAHNGGMFEPIADAEFVNISDDGKYEFYYMNAAGTKSDIKTYYLAHGAEKATLATVSVGEDGKVTVSGADAKLYKAGEKTAISDMNVSVSGKYYLELTKDGSTEIVVIDKVMPVASSSVNGANIALAIVFGVLAAAAIAAGVVLVIKKRRA